MKIFKKIILILSLISFFSCYTIETPRSKFDVKEISKIASDYVYSLEEELIEYKDTRIVKKGYGTWYLTLYGLNNLYKLELDEEGNILKFEKFDYTK